MTTPSYAKILSTPELADAFRKFYLDLYNLRSTPTSLQHTTILSEITTYLQEAQLPMFMHDEQNSLSQPLLAEEFAAAIAATQPGKAPCPDGFTLAYYRAFQSQLTPYFLLVFNAITDGQSVSSKLLTASILVIPKPGYIVPATVLFRF